MCGKRSTGISLLSLCHLSEKSNNVSRSFQPFAQSCIKNCRGGPPYFTSEGGGRGLHRTAPYLPCAALSPILNKLAHVCSKNPVYPPLFLNRRPFPNGAIPELATSYLRVCAKIEVKWMKNENLCCPFGGYSSSRSTTCVWAGCLPCPP